MRKMLGAGTPRRLRDLLAHISTLIWAHFAPGGFSAPGFPTIDQFAALLKPSLPRICYAVSPLEDPA